MAENKFVVNVFWTPDNSIIHSQNFATEKEAEEFRDLTLYAFKLEYGENQTFIQVEIKKT